MAKIKGYTTTGYEKPKPKKTSQSSRSKSVKWSSMNKHKKRSYKVYRKQGA